MASCLKLCALVMACGLAFGCAAQKPVPVDENAMRVERFRRSYEAALNDTPAETELKVLSKAKSAIGTPYVRGGTNQNGFDCSGFVSWAYRSIGVNLPRTAREQSVVGQRIKNPGEMRAGDIVAFRHPRRGYHTGIYVGDGKFIHSPRRRTTVRINSLDDPYFNKTFLGARRVNMDGGENLVAQAETRLSDYTEEKAVRELSSTKKGSSKSRSGVKKRRATEAKVVQVAARSEKSSSPKSSAQKSSRQESGSKKSAGVSSGKNKKNESTASAKNKKVESTSGKGKAPSVASRNAEKSKKSGEKSRKKS